MVSISFRYDFTVLRRVLTLKIGRKAYFFIIFLIPLIVRSIPELLSPVPIGFDTAIYLAKAKMLAASPSILPFFARLLGLLYLLGVDLMAVMKVLPVIVFATTILLACVYAHKRLNWSLHDVLVLAVMMSFSAAMLRMSWDLHRQSMATLLLLGYMCMDPWSGLSRGKIVASFTLVALIGLFHELVLVVVTAINFYLAFLAFKRRSFTKALFFSALALTSFVCYQAGVYLSYGKLASPYSVFNDALARWGSNGYSNLVSHAVGLLVATFWYVLALAPLGFFHDRYLSPWLLVMLAGYLSEILTPFFAVRLADRWMLYMAVPLMFYGARAVSKFAGSGGFRKLSMAVALMIVCLNGFSMLGVIEPFRLPSNLYIGFIPSTMVFSTAKPEHVVAVMEFSKIINGVAGEDACVVTHDPWFKYWATYLTNLKVYSFSGTDPEPAISGAMKSGCGEIYVIWFKGQVKGGELLAERGLLVLYRILKAGS